MNVLRTPKSLAGPEFGIAALGFQAWYEARHGASRLRRVRAHPASGLGRLPGLVSRFSRHRRALRHAPRTHRAGGRVFPAALNRPASKPHARSSSPPGSSGSGGLAVPPTSSPVCPARSRPHRRRHRFRRAAGKDVAVIGGAASAFDAAAVALESGAEIGASVRPPADARRDADQREPRLSRRLRQLLCVARRGALAPGDPLSPRRLDRAAGRDQRVLKHDNFHLHLAAPWHVGAGRRRDRSPPRRGRGQDYRFDFAIAGTGYTADPNLRPEFADFAGTSSYGATATRRRPTRHDPFLGAHPYLGPGNEFLEKTPGAAPYLKDIHCFNPAGFVSFGVPIGDVPSMKRGHPTVTAQISRDLFLADFDAPRATHDRRGAARFRRNSTPRRCGSSAKPKGRQRWSCSAAAPCRRCRRPGSPPSGR